MGFGCLEEETVEDRSFGGINIDDGSLDGINVDGNIDGIKGGQKIRRDV